jgi:hypothetical protein
MGLLKKNTAYTKMFYLGGTGLGPAASISKNGGGFATPGGGAGMTEVGSGWYSLALQAVDTDTEGDLAYAFSNGSMVATFVDQVTVNGPEGGSGLDAAATRAALGLASGNLDTQLGSVGALGTAIATVNSKTTNLPAMPAGVGSLMTLSGASNNAIADALLDRANAVETGVSPRGALRVLMAAACGLVTIAGATVSLFNFLNTKTRILATTNAQGERTEVTIDVS